MEGVRVMKRSLCALAAVALWAVAAPGGEIAVSHWPASLPPQEVADIPVHLDLPWWVWIKDLDKLALRLTQRSAREYEGCLDIVLETQRNLNVAAKITPTGAVNGTYFCSLSSAFIEAPQTLLSICVKLETETTLPPANDVHVGTVTLTFTPR